MKKIFHILVTGLLLLSTTGLSLTRHYCGNTLKEVAVVTPPTHCCGDEKMPDKCCQDKSENFLIEDELLPQYSPKLNISTLAYVINYYEFLIDSVSDEAENLNLNYAFQSPPFTNPDIYIQVQSFLI